AEILDGSYNDTRLVKLSEDVSLTEDRVFLVLESHLQEKVFGEKHTVAGFDRVGDEITFLVTKTRAGSNNGGLENLSLRLLGKHNSALGFNLGSESLDQNTIVERLEGLQKISVLEAFDGTEHDFLITTGSTEKIEWARLTARFAKFPSGLEWSRAELL
ncbi:hypothetical protein PENTCL1PPCAC_11576, partial [Pristionchus entomophagus]